MLKLYVGGSPCTAWSIAQTKNRETEPNGLGWELFKNYLIGLEKYNPTYFLYENNKSMAPAIREQITKELGVEPILINSALVSAQNRQRLYWTNIPGVTQPEDRGILLRDVLESGMAWREKSYTLDASYYKGGNTDLSRQSGKRFMVAEPVNITDEEKAHTLKAQYFKNGIANFITNGGFGATAVAEPIRIGTIESDAKNADFDSQQYRVYSPDGKSVTLCGNGGGVGAKTGLYAVPCEVECTGKTHPVYEVRNGLITIKDKQYPIKLVDGFYIIRKLTVTECKRLQTVPDSYIFPVSNSQAYKMLGNSWTVEVIKRILSFIPNLADSSVKALSMYDGMAAGMLALRGLGVNINSYHASEIDKYCIKTVNANFPEIIQIGDAFNARSDAWEGIVW